MGPHFQRAQLLLQQGRPEMAEKELRAELTSDPNNDLAHGLLALCLADRKEYKDATDEAAAAISLAPDEPFCHFAMAYVFRERNRLKESQAAISEAIRLDPYDPRFFALSAGVMPLLRCETWA